MNRLKKIIVIMLLLTLMMIMALNYSYAADFDGYDGEISPEAENAIPPIRSFLKNILGVVRTVGMIIAVVILVVIACKYMIAAPGERADMKNYLQIYVTGSLVLFGAAGLVGIIRDLVFESLG